MTTTFDEYEMGDPSGAYCPYCHNARKLQRENPDTFDIFDHVQNCPARLAGIAAGLGKENQ